MAWRAHSIRGDDSGVELTGPEGDRLEITFRGAVSGYDGHTWTGVVRKTLDTSPLATIEITFDEGNEDFPFLLTMVIADTSALLAGCTYYFDIRAIEGPLAVTTPIHGIIVPEPVVTPLPEPDEEP